MEPPLDPPSQDWDEREAMIKACEEEAHRQADWAWHEQKGENNAE